MGVVGRHFAHERVVLGGHRYERCSFVACVLVFDGRPVELLDNSFEECSWAFEGAAAVTLDFLASLCREHPELRSVLARDLGLLGEIAPETPAAVSLQH
jgi:hypothetical protein